MIVLSPIELLLVCLTCFIVGAVFIVVGAFVSVIYEISKEDKE